MNYLVHLKTYVDPRKFNQKSSHMNYFGLLMQKSISNCHLYGQLVTPDDDVPLTNKVAPDVINSITNNNLSLNSLTIYH